jgi:hypothetical protein
MNSYERKTLKRAQASWANWKQKAMHRLVMIRKLNLRIRDLLKSRHMWRERALIAEKKLESFSSSPAAPPAIVVEEQQLYFITVSICINLVINCLVSFRSVPKILSIFNNFFDQLGLSVQVKIPHFTTVIGWTLRLGHYLLTRAFQPCLESWICVIDHTIQVGTKKAFVVLKIPISRLKKQGALTLKDVEVLYLKVQEKSNGILVHDILEKIFTTVGNPLQIVMDNGPDLKKGVSVLNDNMQTPIMVTYDLTHFIASLLKKKYQNCYIFNDFLSQIAQVKNKLQQTLFAYLIPVKSRSKSRFLNLPPIGKYIKQIVAYLDRLAKEERDEKLFEQLMPSFRWLFEYQDFLKTFWEEIDTLVEVQKVMKNSRLNDITYKKVFHLVNQLSDPDMRNPLLEYIKKEFEFAKLHHYNTLQTSDCIESLFGKFKNISKPHCMSEINKMVLSLPCITEEITPELTKDAFTYSKVKDYQDWINEEIPETLLSKRLQAFGKDIAPKTPSGQVIDFPAKLEALLPFNCDGQKTVVAAAAGG